MKHSTPKRRDSFEMLEEALQSGWSSLETIPLKGEGEFLVLTVSGLVRLARNGKTYRKPRRADAYGPERTTVNSVKTGNYLGAMAWRWPIGADRA
ncbi:MAG: hypothetical protein HLUCCA05_01815 [Roseibaca calidilacus]|uniref:Uncharacterized protein n=1 Tax=Roseibaca calidilacus TaxID=1666912 RepID=A0A0P7YRQ0_9RHOB|nr:hypothetical protein [Roseibaca calidilacus]KPP91880.1 MAG: hypothetical protein HLUCCA05_01815 [Roseibaca calidilacus]CUX82360.1 hypothetical protein Ga0058931_2328 [Roseibaca calidilacus]